MADIEEEQVGLYFPEFDDVYLANRTYGYSLRDDALKMTHTYDLFKQPESTFGSQVTLYTKDLVKDPFVDRVKGFGLRLFKSIIGANRRVKVDGFKGHYEQTGAKLDSYSLSLNRDGYDYDYSIPSDVPEGYDKDLFPKIEIERLKEVEPNSAEWMTLKEKVVEHVNLPDASEFLIRAMNLYVDYQEDNVYGFKMFIDLEDNKDASATYSAQTGSFLIKENHPILVPEEEYEYEEEVIVMGGTDVSLLTFDAIDSSEHQVKFIYRWEMDELFYEVTVYDPHVDEHFVEETSRYRDIVESAVGE